MPLRSRRTSIHMASAWPGWVDALSSLIMVIIFLLMIFVVSQFFLTQALSGRDDALERLNHKITELTGLLRVERLAGADLRANVSQLSDQLRNSVTDREKLSTALAELRMQRDTLAASVDALTGRNETLLSQLTATTSNLEAATTMVAADREKIELQMRELASLQADLAALRAARKQLEGDVATLAATEAMLRKQLEGLDRQLIAAALARDQLAKQAATAEAAAKSAAEERDRLRGQLQAESAAHGQSTEQLRLTEAQRLRLVEQLAAVQRQAAAETARLSETTDQLRLSESQRRELMELMESLRTRLAATEADNSRLGQRVKLGEASQVQLTEELKKLRRALETSEAAKSNLTEDIKLSEDQRRMLTEALSSLRDRSKVLEAKLADESERTVLAQKEIDRRDIRIVELEKIIAAARAQLASLEAAESADRNKSDQLSQQIADLRGQLERLSSALQISEKTVAEQKIALVDLGQKLNVALATKVEELALYRSEFFGKLRSTLGTREDIRIVGDRFVFQSEVLFDTGSATLGEGGKTRMLGLARTLMEIGARIPKDLDWVLRVDGHTDRRPIRSYQFPSNWELSTARAISVVKYLMEQGIPAERLAAAGFGEFQPIEAGEDEVSLARNRRIELKFDQR